jgi:hypothetical protein
VAVLKLTGAQIQRRWRERQKVCAASYQVDIGPKVMNAMVRRKYLDANETDDPIKVGAAASLALSDMAERDE